MKKLINAKKEYMNTRISDDLHNVVQTAIILGKSIKPKRNISKYVAVTAAAFVIGVTSVFAVMLNTLPVFAKEMSDIPIIKHIAQVFTFVEYNETDEGNLINVKMPAIEITGNSELENRINYEILIKMNEQIEIEKQNARDYKKAFLETGGKEEDYMPVEIILDYSVKCDNHNLVSFVITKSICSATFYSESYFYNYDIETGKEITLKQLVNNKFGNDYIISISNIIKEQIKEREKIGDNAYFEGEDAFDTITEDHNFYINQKGNPVIVFDKYEIAYGYMGIQEFEINIH